MKEGQVLSFAFFLWITLTVSQRMSYPQKKGKTQDLTLSDQRRVKDSVTSPR